LFGRGNWAVIGLAKESHEAFKATLDERLPMIAASQLAASAITRHLNIDTVGLNPFSAPRLDENAPISAEHEKQLMEYSALEPESRRNFDLPVDILDSESYASGPHRFQIHDSLPWYGLWAVFNHWKDVSDLLSIKEQHSYEALERPYKFLQATDKKSVDKDTRGTAAAVRKQFAILLDFHEGKVWIENSNKKVIYAIIVVLRQLGVETFSVAWTYSRSNWPAEILNRLQEKSQYQADFQKRADETTRFRPKEIEKLDDKEVESIVSNYFSMTQLDTDVWVGISTPAQIQLHTTSQPIAVKAVTSATTLLGVTNDSKVFAGAITFQDRITAVSKKNGEFTFRKDLIRIDINDQINLTDVGAAMLRGFDTPSFRKDLQREIKKTRQVPSIEQFWSSWLQELNNAVRVMESSFREILDLDGNEAAGILPMKQPVDSEDALELQTV
jgi:hypothetical protein